MSFNKHNMINDSPESVAIDTIKKLTEQRTYIIPENNIKVICDKAINVLKEDTTLLKIHAPINVIGDIHGQFTDLMKFLTDENGQQILQIDGYSDDEKPKFLFLGDYVDRGPNSTEVFTILLCYKILFPKNVFLLRGNHETKEISNLYGFKDEISEKYQELYYDMFIQVFQFLPLAAVISDRIFCVHGGLSKNLDNISSIYALTRPIKDIEENSFIQDLLWADPSPDSNDFTPSERGTSYTFGSDVAQKFLAANNFELICRAHQVVDNGFDFPFFPLQSVLTIFSAPNYCNEFNNKGAMLIIDPTLCCSFKIIDPNDPNY